MKSKLCSLLAAALLLAVCLPPATAAAQKRRRGRSLQVRPLLQPALLVFCQVDKLLN
jgi:hypothetical protein